MSEGKRTPVIEEICTSCVRGYNDVSTGLHWITVKCSQCAGSGVIKTPAAGDSDREGGNHVEKDRH